MKKETVEEFLARGGKIQCVNVQNEPSPTYISKSRDKRYEVVDFRENWRFNYLPPSKLLTLGLLGRRR